MPVLLPGDDKYIMLILVPTGLGLIIAAEILPLMWWPATYVSVALMVGGIVIILASLSYYPNL